MSEQTATKTRKRASKKQATEAAAEPAPPPACECGKVLDWRDAAYGRGGQCKRCTQRAERRALRGRFIPAAVYVAMLAKRGRP